MMTRKIISGVLFLALTVVIWFLFIRDYDFRVKFSVETLPDIALATFKTWQTTQDGTLIGIDYDQNTVEEQYILKGKKIHVNWRFTFNGDSITTVYAAFKSEDDPIWSRIRSLFDQDIKSQASYLARDFFSKLNEHLAKIRVDVIGLEVMKEMDCLCVPLQTDQLGKAMGMMANYSFLSDYLIENEIEVIGNPVVEVVNWDESEDILAYNFCFPVRLFQQIEHPVFIRRTFPETEMLKAEFFGNYISSDRAWYALIAYAERNNIAILKKPIEIFYNNPNFDKNEKDWKAEVLMPLN